MAPIYIDTPQGASCSQEEDCGTSPDGIPYHAIHCNRAKLLFNAIKEAQP